LPGTSFYEKVKHELVNKTNWSDSDDLALMFKNTYSANFYKQLHRYVHKNYRKHQALATLKGLLKTVKNSNFYTYKRAASYVWYVPATIIEKQKLNRLQHE
jgi:cell fate (sporulation/competence/biofilm development) regulator YmcA (YheA/YmcA/DUF963 family)